MTHALLIKEISCIGILLFSLSKALQNDYFYINWRPKLSIVIIIVISILLSIPSCTPQKMSHNRAVKSKFHK